MHTHQKSTLVCTVSLKCQCRCNAEKGSLLKHHLVSGGSFRVPFETKNLYEGDKECRAAAVLHLLNILTQICSYTMTTKDE